MAFLANFSVTQVLIDLRNIQDLRRKVSRCRRTSASTSKGPGESTEASRAEVLEGGPRVPNIPREIICRRAGSDFSSSGG